MTSTEMPLPPLSAAFATFRPLARRFLQLHAERQAGRLPVDQPADLMDSVLNDTLRRLRGGDIDDTWWRRILDQLGQRYVAPIFLQKPALQEWLADQRVLADFKTLAQNQIVTASDLVEPTPRLTDSYSNFTGEASHFADGPIDVVIAILVAGYLASIPTDQRAVAGIVQTGFMNMGTRLDRLEEGLRSGDVDPITRKAHTHEATAALSLVLRTRAIDSARSRANVQTLLARTCDGDLVAADAKMKAKIAYWTARLCASDPATLSTAIELRTELALNSSELDLSVLDALVALTKGNGQEALRLVRDLHYADARTVVFIALLNTESDQAAIAWSDRENARYDDGFFSGIGWVNWAICSAKLGRWEQAIERLSKLEALWDDCPMLAFVEGAMNAAMLLPAEFRHTAIDSPPLFPGVRTVEGSLAFQFHARAVRCFEFVGGEIAGTNDDFGRRIDDWLLWLRIVDTDRTKADLAREDVRDRMSDGSDAVPLILFATVFEIPYDPQPLRKHLESRKSLGGLDEDEDLAQLLLLQRSIAPHELVTHIEKHRERLSSVVHPSFLLDMEVLALARDKQTHKARTLIVVRAGELGPEHAARLRIVVDAEEGTDPRAELERLYESTKSLVDLRSLVSHLQAVSDNEALVPHLCRLFEHERTVHNALDVVACLGTSPHFDFARIIDFIESNQDLVAHSDELGAAYGRALYLVGRVHDANQVNQRLLDRREDSSDSLLEANVAVVSGDWDRIPVVVDREWSRRNSHDGTTLMYLACLATQSITSPDRALELARLATVKAPNDASVLAGAFWLYFRLGREKQADYRWLKRAAELSSPEEGPLWYVDPKDFVERLLPRRRDVVREVERKWLDGELPMSVAASTFNVSLARMLGHIPANNNSSLDGRKRIPIPIISGERSRVTIQNDWTIGLDVTSVMILEYVGLLRHAIRTLHHVKLAPDVMHLLFQERDEARFHQPSLLAAAKELLALRAAGRIDVVDIDNDPPKELIEETGFEIATLLHMAEQGGGMMVSVLPLCKPGSLKELARLGPHDCLVLTTVDVCSFLYKEGGIDTDDYQRATQMLTARGQVARCNHEIVVRDGPLYIDEIALSYLQDANVLRAVTDVIPCVLIHPETAKRAHALIEESDHGDQIQRWIERIRINLRDAISVGAVTLLPRTADDAELSQPGGLGWRSVTSLYLSRASCHAICIDDRAINRHTYMDDDAGKSVPVVCVADILRYLRSLGNISVKEHWIARHKMRRGGLSYISIDSEELSQWLWSARVEDNRVIESAELRVLRQSAADLAISSFLKEHERTTLSANLVSACKATVERVWTDHSVPVERATALSNWLWHSLVMATIQKPSRVEKDSPRDSIGDAIANRLAVLLLPVPIQSEKRRNLFASWLEQSVLSRLSPANATIIEQAVAIVCDAIVTAPSGQEVYGNLFFGQLPASARREAISRHPELASRCGFSLAAKFQVGTEIDVSGNDLVTAVRQVFAKGTAEIIQDTSGRNVSVRLCAQRDQIVVRRDNESKDGKDTALPEMNVLSPCKIKRHEAVQGIVDRIGATGPDFLYSLSDIADRVLTDDEVDVLLSELANGVAAKSYRMYWQFRHRAPVSIRDIVPADVSYYERLCGPSPTGEDPKSYFHNILIPYRAELLKRDLPTGIEICLLGALRDDLCPGRWIANIEDDAVWDVLAEYRVSNNAFVLIAEIDIAVYRQHDSRFRRFCEEAIEALSRVMLGDDTGGFQACAASLSDFVLSRINVLRGCAGRPGYWKRMCAWMQAGRIVDSISRSSASIDLAAFQEWVADRLDFSGPFAGFADLREEPMWPPGRAAWSVWRDEIVGRFGLLKARHEKAGREIPGWSSVSKEVAEAIVEWERGRFSFPGPLEGHLRPSDRLPEHVASDLEAAWDDDLGLALRGLSNACFRFCVSESALERVRVAVGRLHREVSEDNFERLECSSTIAAATRDITLAGEVGDAAVGMAPKCASREHVVKLLCIILTAAAAHEERRMWVEWLDETLTRVARNLPEARGECLHVFRGLLDTMSIVLPMDSWFQLRASAVASSGC